MKVKRDDVVSAGVAVAVYLWLLGIPQAMWDKFRGRAPRPHLYIPASLNRISNPGNICLENLKGKGE